MKCHSVAAFLLVGIIWVASTSGRGRAGEPPRLPMLRMETGMHSAAITEMATDAKGRLALTCSQDKTARLWLIPQAGKSLPKAAHTLLPLACLRVPVAEGREGRLLACALSPDGSLAAVAGWTGHEWDKQTCIYLFDTATTRLVRRITGLPDVIFSLAFSKSAERLAAVFSGGEGLRIYDPATGRELGRDARYDGLALCADWFGDDRLVTTCEDTGVRLYTDLSKKLPVGARANVRGEGQAPVTLKPAVAKAVGSGVKSAFQTMAEKYEAAVRNQQPNSRALPPATARFSPDGRRIAVGFDSSVVAVVDAATLEKVALPDTELLMNRGSLTLVAWQSDGSTLIAGGSIHDGADLYEVRHWPLSKKSAGSQSAYASSGYRDVRVAKQPLTSLLPLPDGRFLWSSMSPDWGVIENLRPTALGTPPLATHRVYDYRGHPMGVALSADGQTIGFHYEDVPEDVMPAYDLSSYRQPSQGPALFSIPRRQLRVLSLEAEEAAAIAAEEAKATGGKASKQSKKEAAEEQPADPEQAALRRPNMNILFVLDWKDSNAPFVHKGDGVLVERGTLKLNEGEMSRCMVSPKNDAFIILGTSSHVRRFSKMGEPVWAVPAPGETRVVNLSEDGMLTVAGFGDGTIRWYDAFSGRELLAFFPHADQRRWVLWTPQGYYDSSEGGDDLMGWHVNRGRDEAADFLPASRFKAVFRRPDVIQRVLGLRDVPRAVAEANAARGRPDAGVENITEVVARLSPPVVELLTGGLERQVVVGPDTREVVVRFSVHDSGLERASGVEIKWNGRPLLSQVPVPASGAEAVVSVPLPEGAAGGDLSIIANHSFASSQAAVLHVSRSSPPPAPKVPDLYHLAVGVSHLQANGAAGAGAGAGGTLSFPDLKSPQQDAELLSAALKMHAGTAFDRVHPTVLTNGNATREGIRQALSHIATQARTGDLVIVSFAGHGYADAKTEFVLVCHDTDASRLKETGLTGSELTALLAPMQASVVLVLDTCQAGAVLGRQDQGSIITGPDDLSGLVSTLGSAEHGIVVFSSASESQEAVELDEVGGVFTRALVEGLEGKAAAPAATTSGGQRGGMVTCTALQAYVTRRVPALVKGLGVRQTPGCIMPVGVPDFPLTGR